MCKQSAVAGKCENFCWDFKRSRSERTKINCLLPADGPCGFVVVYGEEFQRTIQMKTQWIIYSSLPHENFLMTLVGSFEWTRSRSSMSDGSKSQMNCHDDGRDLDSKSYGKRPQRHYFVSRNFHPSTCMQFVWLPKIAVRVDIQTSKKNQWTHERTTNLQFCRWKHENTKIDQKCFPSLFNTFPILNGFLFSLCLAGPENASTKAKS